MEKEIIVVSPEIWTIATTGIVILIAIATSNRSLRREMSERIAAVRQELGDRIDGVRQELGDRIDGVRRELGERIDGLSKRVDGLSERVDGLSKRVDGLSERIGDLRERLGRVEGLLEGFGLTRRKRAAERRDDEQHGPASPRL